MVASALAFASGFTIETACVYWVHFSERNRAFPTALCSMLIGSAQVLGIGESIRDWRVGACFVLGYGIGTFSAVRRKSVSRKDETMVKKQNPVTRFRADFRVLLGFVLWLLVRAYAMTRPKRIIALDGDVYMVRWFLTSRPRGEETGTPGWYLQHILRADRDRRCHNHPWEWARSWILRGGYAEERYDAEDDWAWTKRGYPDVLYAPLERNDLGARVFHRVWAVTAGGAWTLFHAGPKHGRGWGFRENADSERRTFL